MTFTKETGVKVVKGIAFIVTPTIIILIVLAFLYWRKQKNKKALRKAIQGTDKTEIKADSADDKTSSTEKNV